MDPFASRPRDFKLARWLIRSKLQRTFWCGRAADGTTMRIGWLIVASLVALSSPTRAQPSGEASKASPNNASPKVAVFDFELADSSLEGEKNGPQAAEQARLLRISEQVRNGMAESGKFAIVDIRPVVTAAHNSNLQACGGCDVDLAKQLDADLAVTGVVRKISTLILSMIIYVRDARTGQLVTAASADFRGDTDESWSRTASFLLRNRLLAPNYGVPH